MADEKRDPRLNEALCLALYSTMNATLQLYRDLLAPVGLTYQQLLVLAILWESDESTPGRIADDLMLDSSSVAGLLGRMERAGLIDRAVDETDRRRILVRPTAHSKDIRDRLGWLEGCVSEAMALDHAEAADLVGRLHGLRQTMTDYPRPAASLDRIPA